MLEGCAVVSMRLRSWGWVMAGRGALAAALWTAALQHALHSSVVRRCPAHLLYTRMHGLHPVCCSNSLLLTVLLAGAPHTLQCHTAVVDLFLELEDEPSFFKSSSSSSSSKSGRQRSSGSSGGGGGRAQPAGGMSLKLQGMVGVGVASLGAMAAFYG